MEHLVALCIREARLCGFVTDMKLSELFSGARKGFKVRRERNARKLALEVVGVTLTINRMMQESVDVVEDVFFRGGFVGVVLAEFAEGGIV